MIAWAISPALTAIHAPHYRAARRAVLVVVRDGVDPSTSGFSDRRSTN
jgi:hypothetical protein